MVTVPLGTVRTEPPSASPLRVAKPGPAVVIQRGNQQLERREVDLVVLKQGLDTSSPPGRLLFHLMGAIDEFTADLISEGTLEGLAAARARGRVGGRPTVMTPTMVEMARRMFDEGRKPGEIARELRVGRATVYRHLTDRPSPR
jgi:DNA invertase Pin-like site-specific DNA recombinase